MRRPEVFLKSLRDLRWQIAGYGLGLALLAAFVVFVYPGYRDQLADFELPEALRALIGEADYGSPEGFLAAEFFSWVPIVTVIFAIMAGTSALAGEEANGTLDLLLAQPLTRLRLAAEKIAALSLATAGVVVAVLPGWLLSVPFVEMELSWTRLIGATLNLLPVTLFFVALALWAGVAFADRRTATAVVSAFAVATYFVNYLAALVDVIAPLAWLSPFKYYAGTETMTEGIGWAKAAGLIGLTLLFFLLAMASFQRRDIGVRRSSFALPLLSRGA
jgi:ABC-2 type transport system permease protein